MEVYCQRFSPVSVRVSGLVAGEKKVFFGEKKSTDVA